MAVQLNHTIVYARDKRASAAFLTDVLGLDDGVAWGPFVAVALSNDVTLDFLQTDGPIAEQHYCFLVTEPEFDEVFGRMQSRGVTYWADPGHTQAGEINTHDGGRGIYFEDPDGHNLEVITRPYGDER